MPDDDGTFELSRRKALAGLGTIGVASVGAGLGTSAFFSDTESFEDNSLTAGELDLKVDWEEHYSDWMGAEEDEATMASDPASADYFLPAIDIPEGATFVGPGDEESVEQTLSSTPITASDARPISLNFTNSQDAFWNATSIEAYPDTGANGGTADDGIQDDIPTGEDACEYLADVGGDVAGGLDPTGPRSDNDDTRLDNGDPAPLINLNDVKPGDFGEVTFSFHLCDNPGYVWMNAGNVDAKENGTTEPEAEDPDEEEGRVELLDNILTRLWYDDGNNQVDTIVGQLDVMVAIDTSGSIDDDEQTNLENGVDEFVSALDATGGDIKVGTVEFGGGNVKNKNDLQDPSGLTVTLGSFGGNTPMPAALDIADQALYNDAEARSGAEKLIVLFTDGGPNYTNTSYTEDYTAPRDDSTDWSAATGNNAYDKEGTGSHTMGQPGAGQVTKGEMDETAGVAESIRDSAIGGGATNIATVFLGGSNQDSMSDDAINAYTTLPTYLEDEIASDPGRALEVPNFGDLTDLANELVEFVTTSETVFFLGTLRQALGALSVDNGLPLDGDIPAEEGGGTGEQGCFSPLTTHYIGFEWWLPVDHANQIQGDSVSFDIGFYTEQCRHNDGSGQPAET